LEPNQQPAALRHVEQVAPHFNIRDIVMEIPTFWAEDRETRTFPQRRQVTLRRFGWSSLSQEDAQRHAGQRLQEAWSDWDLQRKPTRREAKVAYSGSDNLPIREEIIGEYPEVGAIVTRNAYGALCLNVPDMLFADIDLGDPVACWKSLKTNILSCSLVIGISFAFVLNKGLGIGTWLALLVEGAAIFWLIGIFRSFMRWRRTLRPERSLATVQHWCHEHPDWRIYVYRTPAGLRLLATHAICDPRSDETAQFFATVGTDPIYKLMCQKQACFRARVSPKPWRIGISARIGWGSWPLVSEKAAVRRSLWVKEYDSQAEHFAACELLTIIGDGQEIPRGRTLREIHDRLSRVGRNLALA
jgi:hypothetical protein